MTTDLQTPLPSHDLGALHVPSNPLRAAARKAKDDDARPALTRQGSMDFLSLLPNGSKATGKIISLSAKLQSNTTRSSIQPSLSASSSSSNLFALHNQPGYKPSHSTSFPAFQGDYVMSAPSPLESAAAAGGPGVGGGGRRLELGAEIPARKARTYNPPPIPQMGPSALRTSTTSSTSLSSNVTTITTTTSTSSSSSMGPPSSTASVSSTRRTSLRPSTMLKRSTSSSGNVNPYVRAAVLSSSASLSSLAPNPTPTPIPENSSPSTSRSSLWEEPPTRLIKPLKPRLSRSISHASSLSLNLVSSPPKPLVSTTTTTTTTPQPSSSFVSNNTYSDGSISPTTILAPLPLAPPSPHAHGPVLVAGGGERKRARLSFQPPPPLNLPLSVGGWAAAKKEQQALGSPFLEMGGGADGGMFAGMQEEERESERKPWEESGRRGSLGEGMMEVDEKEEEERVLGEGFRG